MSTSFKRQVMPVFTPSAVSGEHLESITVGRDAELTAIENTFRSAATSLNRPNVLLVGPRGAGKSHLISLIMHRVSSDETLSSKLAIVWLPEDIYTITTYTDLLRTMIRSLGSEAFPNSSDAGLEDTLRIVAGDQVIVLVAENFDRTLNLIGLAGQRALRAFQHNSGAFMMLASMPAIDEKLLDYDAPFYGAFQIIHLEDLSIDQGRALLIKTAQRNGDAELVTFLESSTGLARLRAVEHLAGGSPRLWLIISGLMTVELLDELVPLFLKMLDELTPYYKARMDELAPAKAKILATLFRLGNDSTDGGPMSVKDIAAACSMSQQTVSKQLHELEKARFVRVVKNEKDKRASYYESREPLLKHCLELKSNKGEPLSLVVSFLAAWFSLTELIDRHTDENQDYLHLAFKRRLLGSNAKLLVAEIFSNNDGIVWIPYVFAKFDSNPEPLVLALESNEKVEGLSSSSQQLLALVIALCIGMPTTANSAIAVTQLLLKRRIWSNGWVDRLTTAARIIARCDGAGAVHEALARLDPVFESHEREWRMIEPIVSELPKMTRFKLLKVLLQGQTLATSSALASTPLNQLQTEAAGFHFVGN